MLQSRQLVDETTRDALQLLQRLNDTRSSAIAEGPRDASCQLKSCQLPRNSAETTCTTSPEPSIIVIWKTLHTSQPLHLSELISHYLPSRSLRSSNTNLLTRPTGITSNFSSRAFSVSAPSTRNSLPAHIRSIDTLSSFKRHLKFHLFQSAFTV